MDLTGLSERSRYYADVLKRFAIPELLALLHAPQPLGLRTAAEMARRLGLRGQRAIARTYASEGKAQALALWRKWRAEPRARPTETGKKRNPMGWMPLARRRLEAIAPSASPAPQSRR